jgi:hypothetical protein
MGSHDVARDIPITFLSGRSSIGDSFVKLMPSHCISADPVVSTVHGRTAASIPRGTQQSPVHVEDPAISAVPDANQNLERNEIQVASSRWNVLLEQQAPEWLNLDADIPEEEISDSYDALTHMDLAGNFLRKVKVNLLCLQWGGEFIGNPCPHVYGYVEDMVLDGIGGDVCFLVDFGAYLGTQMVLVNDCDPWETEEVTTKEIAAVDIVIASAKSELFQSADAASVQCTSLPNRTVDQRCGVDIPIALGMDGSTSLHTQSAGLCSTGGSSTCPGSDSDPEWIPVCHNEVNGGFDHAGSHWGVSSGDSDPDDHDTTHLLLAQLGFYAEGPRTEAEEDFAKRYSDANWHAKTWNLLPRNRFSSPLPGPKKDYGQNVPRPTECFLMLWDDKVQRKIVSESNMYATWVDPKTKKRKGGPVQEPTITLEEFRKFIGICGFMAVREQPQMRDYWSFKTDSLHCDEVASTLTRNRFQYILKCLHIARKSTLVQNKQDPAYDPIAQVRWLLEKLKNKFQAHWNGSEFLCVDESMVAYNGKFCAFKQYLPLKPITHGIKVWCLCCSVTKFILNWEVYVGAENEKIQNLPVHACGSGAGVVTRLTEGWEGKWHTIVMDNFFTSPMLFENLFNRQFYAIGIARQGRIGFPSSLDLPEKGTRGALEVRVHRERKMAAIHWQDTKGVHFLSTHSDPVQRGGLVVDRTSAGRKVKVPTSPIQVAYACNMRGVDTQDQVRAQYTTQMSTKKWWHRLFFFCLDASFTNAYLMYKNMCIVVDKKPMDHYTFLLEVCHDLMGIPLPSDYAKPREKEVLVQAVGTETGQPSGNLNDGTSSAVSLSSALATESWNTSYAAVATPNLTSISAQTLSSLGLGADVDSQIGMEVRSSQESHTDHPNVDPLAVPNISGQRRRRPNRRVRPEGTEAALHNPWAPHHSVHSEERRKCRQCSKRMKWICPRCKGWSMCPGKCFLDFHNINGHNI